MCCRLVTEDLNTLLCPIVYVYIHINKQTNLQTNTKKELKKKKNNVENTVVPLFIIRTRKWKKQILLPEESTR